METVLKTNQVFLFQGDSITDCDRDRSDTDSLGNGYANKFAEIYRTLFGQEEIVFRNRGISGDRSCDILHRYEEDIRNIQPDFLSLLVGINDTWRRYDNNDPTTADVYHKNVESILRRIRQERPGIKILLIEPFLLHTMPDKVCYHEDLDPKIQVIRQLAVQYADFFLPLDGIFAQMVAQGCDPALLSEDGVHPTDYGHSIIAMELLRLLKVL